MSTKVRNLVTISQMAAELLRFSAILDFVVAQKWGDVAGCAWPPAYQICRAVKFAKLECVRFPFPSPFSSHLPSSLPFPGSGSRVPLNFWALMLISRKRLKLRTSNLTCMFPGTVRTWPLKNFRKGGVSRVIWPLNFWALNANSFKTVKATDFKCDGHVSRDSPDISKRVVARVTLTPLVFGLARLPHT